MGPIAIRIAVTMFASLAIAGFASSEPQKGENSPQGELMKPERELTRSIYNGEHSFPLAELPLLTRFWELFENDSNIPDALKKPEFYRISFHAEENDGICLSVRWRRRDTDLGFDLPLEGVACFRRSDHKLLTWFMGRYSAFIDDSVDPESITMHGYVRGSRVGTVSKPTTDDES